MSYTHPQRLWCIGLLVCCIVLHRMLLFLLLLGIVVCWLLSPRSSSIIHHRIIIKINKAHKKAHITILYIQHNPCTLLLLWPPHYPYPRYMYSMYRPARPFATIDDDYCNSINSMGVILDKSKGTVLVCGLTDGIVVMVLLIRAVIAFLRRGLVWYGRYHGVCKLLFTYVKMHGTQILFWRTRRTTDRALKLKSRRKQEAKMNIWSLSNESPTFVE